MRSMISGMMSFIRPPLFPPRGGKRRPQPVCDALSPTLPILTAAQEAAAAARVAPPDDEEEAAGEGGPAAAVPEGAGVFRVDRHPDNPRDIRFELKARDLKIPVEQMEFSSAVTNTVTVLKAIFPPGDKHSEKRFDDFQRKLIELAQVGVELDLAQVPVATQALNVVKREVLLLEGGRAKARYVYRLVRWAAGLVALAGSIYLALGIDAPDAPLQPFYDLRNLAVLVIGTGLGVVVSFMARRTLTSFEDLATMVGDRLDPPLRLGFACAAALIGAMFILTGLVDIEVNGLAARNLLDSGVVALALGALFGLAEMALPIALVSRADRVAGGLAGG